ncbi:MAG: hypothetical protein ACRD0K_00640 [Egibacteraceae bacterium]
MTGPNPDPPAVRTRAVELALRIGVLVDQLERTASRCAELSARDDEVSHLATDAEVSRFRAAADRLAGVAIELAALPTAAAGLSLLARGELADRLRLAAAAAITPDRLPAPLSAVTTAAEKIRQVADALLDPPSTLPATGTSAHVQPADQSCRVEVTATRLLLQPPCGCPPIRLARDATEPLALNRLRCPTCDRRWHVALLGDVDQGLWICWRPDGDGQTRLAQTERS